MGNACSFVREGIDYVLRYVLPRFASYFPGGHNNRIDVDFLLQRDIEDSWETDKLVTKDEDHVISIEQDQNCDKNTQEAAGNAAILQGIISDFFNSYNLEIQALNGKYGEKNVKRKGKHVRSDQIGWSSQYLNRYEALNRSRLQEQQLNIKNDLISGLEDIKVNGPDSNSKSKKNAENISQYLNRYEALNRSRLQEQQLNIKNDLISGLEDIKVNGPDSSSKSKKNAESISLNVHHDGVSGNSAEKSTRGTENSETEPSNMEFNIKLNGSHTSNRGRKHCVGSKVHIVRHREQPVEKFLGISNPENPERFNDESIGDDYSNDRKECKVTEHKVRKLSLPHMHSGCHYSVNEGNESVELTDYSRDSPALRVNVETFRKMSHPNLGSGGMVVFEELSEHLSLPNYYAQNPIVYNELPKDVKFPRTSPLKLPSQQPLSRPASFSGGGIVPTNRRRVSLPILYPQRNPLLHPVTTHRSTGSNFGGLVSPDKDSHKFSDLIFQSLKFDLREPQVVEGEDLNEDRRAVPRRAPESQPSTTGNSTCDGDMDPKRHLGSS